MSQLTVRRATWSELCSAGIEPLVRAHRCELAMTTLPLEFDHELLQKLEALGVLVSIAAHDDGLLCGYAFWTLSPSVETRGILVASQGPLFVVPAARGTSVFARLWRTSMSELRREGVSQVFAHAAQGSPAALSRFLASQGRETYRVWEIDLTKEHRDARV